MKGYRWLLQIIRMSDLHFCSSWDLSNLWEWLPVQARGLHLNGQLLGKLGQVLLSSPWVRMYHMRTLPILDHVQGLESLDNVLNIIA